MKDKSLFLLAIMLITIGLSSSVYAGACKTGRPFVHTAGGCNDPGGSGAYCFMCHGDSDAGGCGSPLGAANVCVHTPKPHAHSNTYNWTVDPVLGFPYYNCIPVAGTAIGGNGANTGASCTAKPETTVP